jgi:glutaconate CoA-transferase subunit A
MPALKLDVALIHATAANSRGVCQISSPDHYMDDWFARAAKHTIVSCDELVPDDAVLTEQQARNVLWERSATQAVVHIPGGAHPSSSAPLYGFDVAHFKDYGQFAADSNFDGYLDAFAIRQDESSYQAKVGGLETIQSIPLPIY